MMLPAILHGKLSRDQENMEDVLTSNVFGLLKYVPPGEGVLPLLACAETTDGEHPFKTLFESAENVSVSYCFWPFWSEEGCVNCEPDVLLEITQPDSPKMLVCVEAKYRSGKSSEEDATLDKPNDQLAKEWDNLQSIARKENAIPYLLYATADMGCPSQSILDSISDYQRHRTDVPKISWISWRGIPRLFNASNNPILQDLVELCRRLNLIEFTGFTERDYPTTIDWRFEGAIFDWSISIPNIINAWRFSKCVKQEKT